MKNYKEEWLGNVKGDILAGFVVCMALIPEVIGFTIVAGVDPMIGIYSSFCISVIIAIFGGRPGMISAAAGSMALVLASLVREHGVEYMLAATILTGIIEIIFGVLKVGSLLRFIPKPVTIGFVNALGIMMFKSQIQHFNGSWILILLGAISIGIIYVFPKITKAIPAPIVSIVVVSIIAVIYKLDIPRIADMGAMTRELPRFIIPNVPFNIETFKIILPYSVSLAIVGLVESLLTAQIVDENTDTESNKNRDSIGQGLANVTAGFFGGIAGCGMIGQTVVNQTYGGRGRLSTLLGGVFMLFSIIILNDYVLQIPVVALASVMLIVSFDTFNFKSIAKLNKTPITDTIVMIVTVIIVVFTDNLAYGVIAGIILAAIFFANKVSNIQVDRIDYVDRSTYLVKGYLFFASCEKFIASFDYHEDIEEIYIDFLESRVCDESAVDAIDKVVTRLGKNGIKANLIGLNASSVQLMNSISESYKTA